jgi:hypothetical protein
VDKIDLSVSAQKNYIFNKENITGKSKNNNEIKNYKIKQLLDIKKYIKTSDYIYNIQKNNEKIYCITNSKIFAINLKGKLLWLKDFSIGDDLFFMSLPVISEKYIFVSSVNNIFLVIDKKNGNIVKRIISPGNINYGNKPIIYKEYLLLPLDDGIYQMNITSFEMNKVISYYSPNTPVIYNNKLLLTSYVDQQVMQFDLISYKMDWAYRMADKSFAAPVAAQEKVIINDTAGTIYVLNFNGKLLYKKKISDKLFMDMTFNLNHIYVVDNRGNLIDYFINTNRYYIIKKLGKPENIELFFTKNILVDNKGLWIGDSDGNVVLIQLKDKSAVINNNGFEISTSIIKDKDRYFFAAVDGKIFQIAE